ncbi:MAG TPA: ATP-binding domain-containing protein [Candidatus Acidoferrales bacterium]|nr:ATP-binding domain-containing protein [Candidatus Acidoferrales bacterium]
MPHPVVVEEVAVLEQVTQLLNEFPTTAAPSETAVVEELTRLREMLRDGVKTEDQAALTEQWNRQSALLDQLRAARQAPQVNRESPYFAHLRLRENGNERDILLGKATRLQRGVRIVDWRNAPISRIFYRYQQGEEYEEEIAGRVMTGSVTARRTVTIRDRTLRRVQAPEGIFDADPTQPDGWQQAPVEAPRLAGGAGAALRAHQDDEGTHRRLGTDLEGAHRRADKHLPDIAGLIDPTQFDLITRPSSGFVVIRGTAGSGKTTVALHRIAYLAYDDPTIDSPQTLVVVFSPALRDYVSYVLPALGVERVQVRTFQEWASEHTRRLFPKLPRQVREDTPALVQRLKLHPGLLVALQKQVQRTPGKATPGQVLDDWASVLCQAPLLEEVFAQVAPDAFTTDELCRAATWNRDRYEELTAWMHGDEEVQAELDAEDDALLLRAWQLRIGPLPGRSERPLRYRHIAIDEVQDFSPVEIQVLLGCLDERQSITLAGDTQQHLMQDAGFTSWASFFKDLGLEGTEVNTLQISYRCSRAIAEFAVGVLGDLREDDTPLLTTRAGPLVELFRFTDHGAAVAFLADALKELMAKERLASVAVLTPARELSAIYHRGLTTGEVPRLRRVENQDFTFAPGVEVTEIEQVKGLEFDYVILVEVSTVNFPDTAAARRLLHVGATRAVHQLWLTTVGSPSALTRNQFATR